MLHIATAVACISYMQQLHTRGETFTVPRVVIECTRALKLTSFARARTYVQINCIVAVSLSSSFSYGQVENRHGAFYFVGRCTVGVCPMPFQLPTLVFLLLFPQYMFPVLH